MNSDSDQKTGREEWTATGLAPSREGAIVTSLLMIGVGVVLLLSQLGVLPATFLPTFWPAFLILAGLLQVALGAGGQRVFGACLALAGAFIQLKTLGVVHFSIWDLWPLFIVAAGVALLWNILQGRPMVAARRSTLSELNATYVFSGTDRKVEVKNFRGGKIDAVFGGFKIDLTRSELEGEEVVLQVDAVFGGGEIIVPESWTVIVDGTGVFGAFEDQTRRPSDSQPGKVLRITGAAVFGGVVVRNPR